ncbi:MAG: hypothetical protein E7158_05600 [Firmicutes bacterium]|nr:hypothetical protein [Bacillota bacterium]
MKYMVAGSKIEIDTDKKPFSKGSEGKVFLKNGTLYKIYYENALNEGFGDKLRYHSYLSSLTSNQIDLPNDLIFDNHGNYVGYTTTPITRKTSQQKYRGITLLPKDILMNNLEILLKDIKNLTDNFILLNDVTILNFILQNEKMHIIDPGRYRIVSEKEEEENIGQFKNLLSSLIYLDLKYDKVDKIKKIQTFRSIFNEQLLSSSLLEFFDKELDGYNNVSEYAKERIRYIK